MKHLKVFGTNSENLRIYEVPMFGNEEERNNYVYNKTHCEYNEGDYVEVDITVIGIRNINVDIGQITRYTTNKEYPYTIKISSGFKDYWFKEDEVIKVITKEEYEMRLTANKYNL